MKALFFWLSAALTILFRGIIHGLPAAGAAVLVALKTGVATRSTILFGILPAVANGGKRVITWMNEDGNDMPNPFPGSWATVQKAGTAAALLLCILGFTGCMTTAPTTTASAKIQKIAADTPTIVSAAMVPVLQKNPKYAPEVLLIATTLPTLLQNGPITPGSIIAALEQIPNLTAQERTDLSYVASGLPLVLLGIEDVTGKTVVLYTDPGVSLIVNAFCQGLKDAASTIPGGS